MLCQSIPTKTMKNDGQFGGDATTASYTATTAAVNEIDFSKVHRPRVG